jgi:hypothetical protein
MSRRSRIRLNLETLGARIVPSAVFDAPPAFRGLDVAVERFYPTDPISPVTVSPVFALNYGESSDAAVPALSGLSVADALVPPNPVSPVFFAMDGAGGGGDVTL